jgi:hypothetical protein
VFLTNNNFYLQQNKKGERQGKKCHAKISGSQNWLNEYESLFSAD